MDTIIPIKEKCPFCAEEIHSDAIKCKHCGEILDPVMRSQREQVKQTAPSYSHYPAQRKWSLGIAALLSFIIPGAGQLYKSNVGSGLAWFVFTLIGYFLLIVPGIILHLICIIAATSGDPYK